MRYSNRLFLYAPLFALLALAVAAGLRWRVVADSLESWLRQRNGHEIAPGVELYFATESVGGFPFNVDAVLHNVTFRMKSARTAGTWHTDGFAIHELTFGQAHQIYEAAGTQTVSWTDAEGGTHHFAFVPGSLMASAILSGGRLMRFDLDVNGIGSRDISGARLQLHFRKAPTRDAIEIAASADDLRLAPALQTGFGAHLRHAKIAATLTPATPFIPLFEGREVWDGALEAWRRGGGAVHLDDIEIKWNGVQIHATGGLGLDDHHSPQGTLALDIEGAIKAPAAGTTDGQLVRAVVQLIKVANEAPRAFTVSIALGRVNLRVTKAPHTMAGAGSLGPLY